MKPYVVEVFDRCGTFCATELETFPEALSAVNDSRIKYPDKVVRVFNVDRVDLGFDGLTDQERWQLEDMGPVFEASIEQARQRKVAS